jgi:hypothetical protein
MKLQSKAIAALGVAALALPAAAMANHGHHNGASHTNNGHHNGQNKPHSVMYVLKGTYSGDGSTVSVTSANHHGSGLVGQDVAFDFSSAKISVADTNADTVMDINDVVAGDKVLVQVRLPKGDPATQPIVAKHLVDQTNPDDSSSSDPTD